MLITLEGLDGTGKSTLAGELSSMFKNTIITKEPGSPHTPLGKTLRQLGLENRTLSAFERELIFYVDASQHKSFIENHSEDLVISDRGYWSHLAYLYGCLKTKQLNYDEYAIAKRVINQICAMPDIVLYLKGDIDLMKERLKDKPKDVIEGFGPDYFAYVLATYDDLLIERNRQRLPTLVLNARDRVDNNIALCKAYIEDVINHELRLKNPS